jgi:5-methylcytosine-specific restriction protein A
MTDHRTSEAEAYRRLYKLAAWCAVPHGLRWRVLVRDLFTCQRCGYSTHHTKELVAHHKTPHKGDYNRFFDEANVITWCKTCHDGPAQSEDRTGIADERGVDASGRPTSAAHPWNKTPGVT